MSARGQKYTNTCSHAVALLELQRRQLSGVNKESVLRPGATGELCRLCQCCVTVVLVCAALSDAVLCVSTRCALVLCREPPDPGPGPRSQD